MNPLKAYPREVKVFLAASLINATGSALMWPLVSMFVFDELGRSMADAGLAILIQSLGGIAGQLFGGSFYHRIGVKRLIVGALALNALGLFLLPFVREVWPLFLVTMGLIGLFNSVSSPAIQAFVGFRFAERRAELFNVIYVANNIGVALGTAMSGFLADLSYNLSFVLNGVSCALFAGFFLIYLGKVDEAGLEEAPQRAGWKSIPPADDEKSSAGGTWALLSNVRLYLLIAIGGLLLQVGNSIWNTGVSPSIIASGMEKKAYGFLWTLNGIMIFVAQPLTALIRRFAARTVTAQMTASSAFYLAGYACILLIQSYPGMITGMVFATLGEMLIAPAVPAYLSENGGRHAPFYIGLTGGIGSVGRVFGPFVMGSLFDGGGLTPVAWLAVVTAGLSTVFYGVHSRIQHSSRLLPAAGKER
ncbi:MFS transporter [Gorillibacterium timonense]|uniref:MFS transporter n=1 Tax=Gorillibacterium timonense TaxID=1689269 RepID=UPI00071D449C|nr:MFS transporter [Gorillibacterium timonense]